MFVSETYELLDAKYYASDSRINSEGIAYNGDRKLFASTYLVEVGDSIHFRFKSIPYRVIFGIGSIEGSDITIEKIGSTYNRYRNVLTNSKNINSSGRYTISTEYDYIFEKTTRSEAPNKVAQLYNNNVLIDWWQIGDTIKRIRVDKFNNYNFEIEVFVL